MKSRVIGLVLVLVTLIYTGFIFMLSSQNGEETTALSKGVSYNIAKIIYNKGEPTEEETQAVHLVLRKSAHIVLFFMLGLLASATASFFLRKKLWLSAVISLIIVWLYAFFDEWHKLFIAGRHFDVGEAVLNGVCGLLGVAVVVIISYIKKKSKC